MKYKVTVWNQLSGKMWNNTVASNKPLHKVRKYLEDVAADHVKVLVQPGYRQDINPRGWVLDQCQPGIDPDDLVESGPLVKLPKVPPYLRKSPSTVIRFWEREQQKRAANVWR
jgi:hypothetical protein